VNVIIFDIKDNIVKGEGAENLSGDKNPVDVEEFANEIAGTLEI